MLDGLGALLPEIRSDSAGGRLPARAGSALEILARVLGQSSLSLRMSMAPRQERCAIRRRVVCRSVLVGRAERLVWAVATGLSKRRQRR
eukprot:2507007-Pleurochrysis_carterae.AAC.1